MIGGVTKSVKLTSSGGGGGGGGVTLDGSMTAVGFALAGEVLSISDLNEANGLVSLDGSSNLYLPGDIYPSGGTIWASPANRFLYDQYNEQAISTMSDTWDTDNTTTLISDPDYGYVAVNGALIVRNSIQLQSFGGSTALQLNADGSSSFANGLLTIDSYGNVNTEQTVTAESFHGDGSSLTGIVISGDQMFFDGGDITSDGLGNLNVSNGDYQINGIGTNNVGGLAKFPSDASIAFLGMTDYGGNSIAIGYTSVATLAGVALGTSSNSVEGVSVGYNAQTTTAGVEGYGGVAIGYFANDSGGGAALGPGMQNSGKGVNIGSANLSAPVNYAGNGIAYNGDEFVQFNGSGFATLTAMLPQFPTTSPPTYVLGGWYFDNTLNKLRIGGASGWETVTSI